MKNKAIFKSMKLGFAVWLSILVTCCNSQATRTEPDATAPLTTPMPFITASPTVTLDPKIALRESLIQVLGMGSGEAPRLTKISYSKPEAGDITITWVLLETVPQNSRKAAAQMDATNILKALQDNKTRFIYVVLIGTFSMQDEHGNTIDIPVMDLGFNKSRLEKVNWVNFRPSDVYDLADIADVAEEWK